jgi:nucleoside-diphosphate-sugar epimerase
MVTIFLTGATGYLGNTFLSTIPETWDVYCYGRHAPVKPLPKNVIWLEGDLTNTQKPIIIPDEVDTIIHLAAIKGNSSCATNPSEVVKTNIIGTHRLLSSAKEKEIKKIVFASTYWVYGSGMETPFDEKMPVSPNEMYGISKAASELEIISSGINFTILRFGNIFGMGSGINPEEVVYYFIRSACTGSEICLEHGGRQEIDTIDISDVCSVLKAVTFSRSASCEIFNIGNGVPRSIASIGQEIRDIFQRKFNKDVRIITNPPDNIGTTRRYLSMKKFYSRFPEIKFRSFEESIEKYIEDFQVMR